MRKPPTINEVLSMTERPDYSGIRLTRNDAIRRHCLDCMGFSQTEVRECPDTKCSLWRFRLGKEVNDELNPKKELTEEERNALTKRLAEARNTPKE